MYPIKLSILKSINILSRPFTNGTSLIGKIDEVLKFNILDDIDLNNTVVIFTIGTNGKTTTNNLISEILSVDNKVLINTEGANLTSGIKTSIIKKLKFNKKIDANVLCLEVDEKTLKNVVKVIKPNHIVVTNFFRDQLDRYGEIDTIIEEIVQVIDNTNATLHLNGNDPLIVDRFKNTHNIKNYFGIDEHAGVTYTQDKIVELKYCPECLKKLDYKFYHYGHIGNYECSNCHFKTPDLTTLLKLEENRILINDLEIEIDTNKFPTYFYFNILAAAELVSSVDKNSLGYLKDILTKFEFPKGRSQHINFNGREIYFNLAKNVVGMEETLEYATKNYKEFDLLIAFNDNYADGRDVSWIWDSNMAVIKEHVKDITITGTRRYDMAIRMESEMDNKIEVIEDVVKALDNAIENNNRQLVIISNYTPLETINKYLGEK